MKFIKHPNEERLININKVFIISLGKRDQKFIIYFFPEDEQQSSEDWVFDLEEDRNKCFEIIKKLFSHDR